MVLAIVVAAPRQGRCDRMGTMLTCRLTFQILAGKTTCATG
jgi:hypothetical protein